MSSRYIDVRVGISVFIQVYSWSGSDIFDGCLAALFIYFGYSSFVFDV